MRFTELMQAASLTCICGSAPENYTGIYAGDLLSRAMGRIQAGNIWITIMNNMNVIAVASLTEVAAVVLAEGITLMPDAAEAAAQKGIPVYTTDKTVYEFCRCAAALENTAV